jgi:hypothetical protein
MTTGGAWPLDDHWCFKYNSVKCVLTLNDTRGSTPLHCGAVGGDLLESLSPCPRAAFARVFSCTMAASEPPS